jgi:hypothetical protein
VVANQFFKALIYSWFRTELMMLIFLFFFTISHPQFGCLFPCFRDHNIMGFNCKYIVIVPFYVSTFCYDETTVQEGTVFCGVTSC